MKTRVVFVCVENSCRSQMAEGFARALAGPELEIHSAGSRPSGKINETAIRLMSERGIDIKGQASKSLHDLPPGGWDAVVTMGCGDACPHLASRRRLDWALPDPKQLPDEKFREVRDEIGRRVAALLAQLRR